MNGYQNNDPAYDEPYGDYGSYRPSRRNSLSTASFALALGAVFTCFILYISIPLGALAVILGLLSRGKEPLSSRTRFSVFMAAGAMAVSISITGFAFYRVYTNPELRTQFESIISYYKNYLGLDASYGQSSGNAAGQDNTGSSDLTPAGSDNPDSSSGTSGQGNTDLSPGSNPGALVLPDGAVPAGGDFT